MSNYPPGVTGFEDAIAGPYEKELDEECPNCEQENALTELRWSTGIQIVCGHCDYTREEDYDGPDPDAARDRMMDRD